MSNTKLISLTATIMINSNILFYIFIPVLGQLGQFPDISFRTISPGPFPPRTFAPGQFSCFHCMTFLHSSFVYYTKCYCVSYMLCSLFISLFYRPQAYLDNFNILHILCKLLLQRLYFITGGSC